MGVYLALVNHDEMYRTSHTKPVLVNDFDTNNQEQMTELNSIIFTSYDKDSLEILPSCDCGHLSGADNTALVCPECNTQCLPVTERPLESVLWIAKPEGVAGLINPEVFIILKNLMFESGVNVFEWLLNPSVNLPQEREPRSIVKMKQLGVERGYNNFIINFDKLMDTLINERVIKFTKPADRDRFSVFIARYRDSLFSSYVPIPSKLLFVTEDSAMGVYADTTGMEPAIEAIRTISSINSSITPPSLKTREARTVKALSCLAEYYGTFYDKSLSPKEGWFRKHIYGSRSHFSFRAVLTSITRPHSYDELHLPWGMSVMLFKVHLTSKLLRRGFTPNEALKHIYENTLKYDILLDELFNELIQESSIGGIGVILQRNPSLTRGSAQALRVTKVKTEVQDNTISSSVLILSSFNADFDGDQLNGLLIHDHKTWDRVSRLAPHLYALDTNKPWSVSKFLELPSPVVANIANWLHR